MKLTVGATSYECASFKLGGQLENHSGYLEIYNTAGASVQKWTGLGSYNSFTFDFNDFADADTRGLVTATPLTTEDTSYTLEVKIDSTTGKLYAPSYSPGDIVAMLENELDGENIYAVGQELTVEETYSDTPDNVTLFCHWEVSADGSTSWTDITGATEETFTVTEDEWDKYVRRVAYAAGRASGVQTTSASTQILASLESAAISGTLKVGETLTLTPTLSPAEGVTAPDYTYQWTNSDSTGGTFANVEGTTGPTGATYVVDETDYGKYMGCEVEADTTAYGTVNAGVTGPIVGLISAAAITGNTWVGQTLTAGVTTSPATGPSPSLAYQWSTSATSGGEYADVTGATAATLVLASTDYGNHFKVAITGTGDATGTATSSASTEVLGLLASVAITGTTTVDSELTAVPTLSPASGVTGPDYTYQWYATDVAITGATASTYTLTDDEFNDTIKVTVTADTTAQGTQTSTSTVAVKAKLDSAAITGTFMNGETLTAVPTMSPSGATGVTYTYQWKVCDTVDGTYVNAANGTSSTYELDGFDVERYFKVTITAGGNGSGAATSDASDIIAAELVSAAISGTEQVGQELTATPTTDPASLTTPATFAYQWSWCATTGGTYENLTGATAATYTLQAAEEGDYIKVAVSATGTALGSVESDITGAIAGA